MSPSFSNDWLVLQPITLSERPAGSSAFDLLGKDVEFWSLLLRFHCGLKGAAATSCSANIREGSHDDCITFKIAAFDLCLWRCVCEISHLKDAIIVPAAAETFEPGLYFSVVATA